MAEQDTDHRVTVTYNATEIERLHYEGNSLKRRETVERDPDSIPVWDCSCGQTFNTEDAATDHLREMADVVDTSEILSALRFLVPDGAGVSWDEDLLFSARTYETHIRLRITEAEAGRPVAGRLILVAAPSHDHVAVATDRPWVETFAAVMDAVYLFATHEGTLTVGDVASTIGADVEPHYDATDIIPRRDY